jgi:8-oxo-dGTP pyrophosphatase MutT (NUDIX family)
MPRSGIRRYMEPSKEILKIESEEPIKVLTDDEWFDNYGGGLMEYVLGREPIYTCPPKRRHDLDTTHGFRDEYLKDLFKHMSKGKSYESFGGRLGISSGRKLLWEKNIMEWRLVKEFGMAACREFWEELGIDIASGDRLGNASVYNTTMTALFKDAYGKQQEIKHDHNYNGQVVLKIETHQSAIPILTNDQELPTHLYEISDGSSTNG